MKTNQSLLFSFCILLLCWSCSQDQDSANPLLTECYPTKISEVANGTTSTVMELIYDEENRIQSSFIYDYLSGATLIYQTDFIYDTSNKIQSAKTILQGFAGPESEYEYFYNEDTLVEIHANTIYPSVDLLIKTRIFYDTDGFVELIRTENVNTGTIQSDFINQDGNGNLRNWSKFGSFLGSTMSHHPSQKGLFADMDYGLLVAYHYTTGNPAFLCRNTLDQQLFVNSQGNSEIRLFNQNQFNELDFQTHALDASGQGYIFEYNCQ